MINKMEELNTTLILSKNELWYLVKIFGPGTVIGITDPTSALTAEEIAKQEVEVEKSLIKNGHLYETETKSLKLDERLAPILFACIHPHHVLAVTDLLTNNESYFYFLPGFHLKLSEQADQYVLTVLKYRHEILSSVLSSWPLDQLTSNSDFNLVVDERDFEWALYLIGEGTVEKAVKLIKKDEEINVIEKLLRDLSQRDLHLDFNMIYHINNQKLLNNSQQQLIQSQGQLYWLTRYYHGDNQRWELEIQSITYEQIKTHFEHMLPIY